MDEGLRVEREQGVGEEVGKGNGPKGERWRHNTGTKEGETETETDRPTLFLLFHPLSDLGLCPRPCSDFHGETAKTVMGKSP